MKSMILEERKLVSNFRGYKKILDYDKSLIICKLWISIDNDYKIPNFVYDEIISFIEL